MLTSNNPIIGIPKENHMAGDLHDVHVDINFHLEGATPNGYQVCLSSSARKNIQPFFWRRHDAVEAKKTAFPTSKIYEGVSKRGVPKIQGTLIILLYNVAD